MTTEGFAGFYIETRDYAATARFWASLGFVEVFETDHASGQWVHPGGGPYVFIAEQHEGELTTHPILRVADATAFAPEPVPDYARAWTPQHWGVVEAIVADPDGRDVSLQAPVPDGVDAPTADAHHDATHGST